MRDFFHLFCFATTNDAVDLVERVEEDPFVGILFLETEGGRDWGSSTCFPLFLELLRLFKEGAREETTLFSVT